MNALFSEERTDPSVYVITVIIVKIRHPFFIISEIILFVFFISHQLLKFIYYIIPSFFYYFKEKIVFVIFLQSFYNIRDIIVNRIFIDILSVLNYNQFARYFGIVLSERSSL